MIYAIPVYPMAQLHPGADQVALFFCVAAVFAAAVGALSMAITVGAKEHRSGRRAHQSALHLC